MTTAQVIQDFWGNEFLIFFCPACDCTHSVRVKRGANTKGGMLWSWNRSATAPSLQPGINLWATKGVEKVRCHSTVTDGQITYMENSTHELRGQTVPLPQLREMLT